MVFSLPDVLSGIERRSRCLLGLRYGGIGLSAGGITALGMAGCHHLGLLSLGWSTLGITLGLQLLLAVILYFLGWKRRVELSRYLLQVDLALGTQERLSSLYELRCRGGGRPFRRRIEETLQDQPLKWKNGLPVRLLHVLPACVGMLTMAGAVLLVMFTPALPLDLIEESPQLPMGPVETRITAPSAESSLRTVGETEPETDLSLSEQEPTHNLEDVLGDIWEIPTAGGTFAQERADLTEMIETQRDLASALSELLSGIEERLQQEKTGLTEEEHRALSDLLSQLANSPLRQILEELLQEGDPEAIEEQVKQALTLIRTLADLDAGVSNKAPEEGLPEEDAGEGEAGQALTWKVPEAVDESTGGESAGESRTTTEEISPLTEDDRLALGKEDRFGGVEGTAGGEGSLERQPGFISTDLAGIIGSQGDFQEFLTKGVPLEPVSGLDDGEAYLSVDYDALRALFEGRAISTEAQDVVRTYFEMITQEGT